MKIKVLTLNIWGGELLDKAINFIHKENPDIALFQEVFNGEEKNLDLKYQSYNILKQKLNLPHSAFEASFIDTSLSGRIPNGNVIFSRFPIENKKIIFFDVPFGEVNLEKSDMQNGGSQYLPMSMLRADIKIDDRDFSAYSVHGIWGFDGEDNDRRLAMSETIIEEIKDRQNVILAGDFNVKPDTKTIENIENHLQNVFKNELTSTFNMKHKKLGGYATAVVDMIFASNNIKIVTHFMPDVDVSDHMPLVCELEI